MSEHAPSSSDVNVPKFQVPGFVLPVGAVCALAGLGATGLAMSQDAQRGMLSYLVGFAYWFTLAMGSLLMILAWRASGARWVVGVRRLVEVMATAVIPMGVLALPVLFMGKSVYHWMEHPAVPEGMNDPTLFRNSWLTVGFFQARGIVFFIFWGIVAWMLLGWSRKQDNAGADEALVRKQIRLGSGGMPLVFLTATFAVFDWMMGLEEGWGSTMYGAQVLTGGFLAALAMSIILTHRYNRAGQLQGFVTVTHLHNLGKMMFAAVCFWTYLSVSQYLLIWIANLPEEIPFFAERIYGSWKPIFFALIFLHFIVPFLLLLPRQAKINATYVSAMAAFLLVMHFVDISWLVLPSKRGNSYHWADFTAVLGCGGVWMVWLSVMLRHKQVAPKGDPDFAVHETTAAPAH